MVLQANNDAEGDAGDAAEGGGGEENANNAEDHADEEENNAANQDAENGAQNGDGQLIIIIQQIPAAIILNVQEKPNIVSTEVQDSQQKIV